MTWIAHIFAAVGIFISSLLGIPSQSVISPPVSTTSPVSSAAEATSSSTNNLVQAVENIATNTSTASSGESSTRVLITSISDLSSGQYDYGITNGTVTCDNICFNSPDIDNADLNTFAFLYDGFGHDLSVPPYTADKNHVYCGGQIMANADPRTFTPLAALWDKISGDYEYRVAKDSTTVFFNCDSIPGADPAFFTLILNSKGDQTGYAKDKNSVYFMDGVTTIQPILVTHDVSGFTVLSGDLTSSNPQYLGVLVGSNAYAADSEHVYLNGKIVPNASPASFQVPQQ